MKRVLVMVAVLMLGAGICFSQDVIPSRISGVTLFTNQALVKREARLKVKEGLNEILLEVEVFNLDRDSVQAKVYGDGEIYSVQFREIHLKESPQENIRKLEEKIKKLEDERKALGDEIGVLGKKDTFLNSLIDFSQTQVPEDIKTQFPDTEDLQGVLSFLGKNLGEINKERQKLDLEIEELTKRIKVLQRELSSLKNYARKSKRVIEVLFNSLKDQDVRVEASYLVYNASWQPFYKVDVPLDLREVNLVMFSKIRQKTGEDWQDISLSVSNVIPLRGVALPSLSSWYLDIPRLRPMSRKSGFIGGEPLESEYDAFAPMKEKKAEVPVLAAIADEEAGFAHAQRKELPLSFEYDLTQQLDIESQDKETILPLFTKTLKGDFYYYVVPRVNPLTFLVCEASSDKEILSGYLNAYFGGRFVGKTYLSEKEPGEDFNVSLGADREVRVKLQKIKDKIKETFFGKIQRQTVVRELAFKITVENLKDKPIKIKVLDSVPVSKTDKIEVKDLKISPKPKEEDFQDREGVVLWEFRIDPGKERQINIEFTVTYPKDVNVAGL